MYSNIHLLAGIITVIFYFVLKSFKYNNLSNKTNNKTQSNLIYILFAPITVYLTYFFINTSSIQEIKENLDIESNLNIDNIVFQQQINDISSKMSSIYPAETTLSTLS